MTEDDRSTPEPSETQSAEIHMTQRVEEGFSYKRATEDFAPAPVNLAPAGDGPTPPAQMLDQGTPVSGSTTETPSGGAAE